MRERWMNCRCYMHMQEVMLRLKIFVIFEVEKSNILSLKQSQ